MLCEMYLKIIFKTSCSLKFGGGDGDYVYIYIGVWKKR